MSVIKQKRIASEIVRVISNILMEDARDNLLKTITITGCEVASDLSSAKVYFTSMSDMEHKDIEKELAEASGYIRTLVAEKMDLRTTPKLIFVYDESIAYGNKIERIIQKIHEDS